MSCCPPLSSDKTGNTGLRLVMPLLTAICLVSLIGAYILWEAQGSYGPAALLLISVAYVSGGIFALRNALNDLRRLKLNIDALMITAALGAAILGEYLEGGVLLFLFSLSGTLEQLILGRTRSAIKKLMRLWPDVARRINDTGEELVAINLVVVGDILEVRPGERIATDGQIISGNSHLDQSAVTGEALPVAKSVGDTVIAGCLNREGSFRFKVTVPADKSTLAKIIGLVEEAQSTKAESEIISRWFGESYTLAVFGGAIIAFLVFSLYLGQSIHESFYRSMMLLVVASPCAVVMSIPSAILAGTPTPCSQMAPSSRSIAIPARCSFRSAIPLGSRRRRARRPVRSARPSVPPPPPGPASARRGPPRSSSRQ